MIYKKFPKRVALLILVIAALALGAFLVTKQDKPNKNGTTADVSGANRQNALSLADKSVTLTAAAIKADLSRARDVGSKKQAAYDNATQLGEAVKDLYDSKTQAKFNTYWKAYEDGLFKYAEAAKKNDQVGMGNAAQVINFKFAKPLGSLIHQVNPTVPALTLQSVFQVSSQQFQQGIQALANGNENAFNSSIKDLQSTTKFGFTTLIDGVKKSKSGQTQKSQNNKPSKQTGKPTNEDLGI